jgi:hypothetical protein
MTDHLSTTEHCRARRCADDRDAAYAGLVDDLRLAASLLHRSAEGRACAGSDDCSLKNMFDLPRCSVPGWRRLVRRAAGSLGGCGDVAEHPAEYDAVEWRYGPPVRVSGEPSRLEDSPLAVGGHAVMVSADRHFEPGQAG